MFELAAGRSTITALASNGADGAQPVVDFLDARGDLVGTTFLGGANNEGTIVEISPVPEPRSLVLLGLGLLGVASLAWRVGGRSG